MIMHILRTPQRGDYFSLLSYGSSTLYSHASNYRLDVYKDVSCIPGTPSLTSLAVCQVSSITML